MGVGGGSCWAYRLGKYLWQFFFWLDVIHFQFSSSPTVQKISILWTHYGIIFCIHSILYTALIMKRDNNRITRTWAVQKVSDVWLGKIHLHAWRSATLIPFEVVSLWLNTFLPVVLPLFKAFLECLFANRVQLSHRVPYNVVSWFKSSPIQLRFQVGEQPIIARSQVGRGGSLSKHRNVVFGQESLNQLWGMSWCIVMMQLPHSHCPQVRFLAPHSIMEATKDFQVVFFVNVFTLWCILVMHHPTGVKENHQHDFDVAPHLPGFFWPRGCWMFLLWQLRLGFWVVPVNSWLITSGHNVQEFGVDVCGVQHILCDFQTELLLLHH